MTVKKESTGSKCGLEQTVDTMSNFKIWPFCHDFWDSQGFGQDIRDILRVGTYSRKSIGLDFYWYNVFLLRSQTWSEQLELVTYLWAGVHVTI